VRRFADLFKEWWGEMSGALSVPFSFLALFNIASQRLLFGILAYLALWGLVIAQYIERARATERCVNKACKLLEESPAKYEFSFNAICDARAHELRSNKQIITVCDELKKYGHHHPFESLESRVPKKDWLEFVRHAVRRPKIRIDQIHGDYFDLAHEWPKMKGYPEPIEPIKGQLIVIAEMNRILD